MKKRNGRKKLKSQTWSIDDASGIILSRRQFSLGVSGIVLAGTTGGTVDRNTSHPHAPSASCTSAPCCQILTPHAFHQPQYTLSETSGCAWSPDSRALATFQENVVTLYETRTGQAILMYCQHTDEVLTVKWSMDGHYLASSGFDPTMHV